MKLRKTREERIREKILKDAIRLLPSYDIHTSQDWELVGVDSTMDLGFPASQTVQVVLRRRLR
jgi:hypothetical protein